MTIADVRQIHLRRNTLANFTASNPVLGLAEVCCITDALDDANRLKIGDGTTAFISLPFFAPSAAAVPIITGTGGPTNFTATISSTVGAGGLYAILILDAAHNADPQLDWGTGNKPIRDSGGATGLTAARLDPDTPYPVIVFPTYIQMVASF